MITFVKAYDEACSKKSAVGSVKNLYYLNAKTYALYDNIMLKDVC